MKSEEDYFDAEVAPENDQAKRKDQAPEISSSISAKCLETRLVVMVFPQNCPRLPLPICLTFPESRFAACLNTTQNIFSIRGENRNLPLVCLYSAACQHSANISIVALCMLLALLI